MGGFDPEDGAQHVEGDDGARGSAGPHATIIDTERRMIWATCLLTLH